MTNQSLINLNNGFTLKPHSSTCNGHECVVQEDSSCVKGQHPIHIEAHENL